MKGLFDGLENTEAEYTLPNGVVLKVVALDLFQLIDAQARISAMKKGDTKTQLALYKDLMQQCVVDKDYQPALTKADVNRLSRMKGGSIPVEVFALIWKLSQADAEAASEAKKK